MTDSGHLERYLEERLQCCNLKKEPSCRYARLCFTNSPSRFNISQRSCQCTKIMKSQSFFLRVRYQLHINEFGEGGVVRFWLACTCPHSDQSERCICQQQPMGVKKRRDVAVLFSEGEEKFPETWTETRDQRAVRWSTNAYSDTCRNTSHTWKHYVLFSRVIHKNNSL